MAYSRYGNLPGLLSNHMVPPLQRNTNNPTRKLPPAGIHPTGIHVSLPKRSRKLQPPVVMASTRKSTVVKTDVDENHANRDGGNSSKDPHKATDSMNVSGDTSIVANVIPEVTKLGDVLDRNKDGDESPRDPHKAPGSINIYDGPFNVPKVITKVTKLGDVFDKDGGNDDVLTDGINYIPKKTVIIKDPPTRRRLPAEAWALDYWDDDTLPNPIMPIDICSVLSHTLNSCSGSSAGTSGGSGRRRARSCVGASVDEALSFQEGDELQCI